MKILLEFFFRICGGLCESMCGGTRGSILLLYKVTSHLAADQLLILETSSNLNESGIIRIFNFSIVVITDLSLYFKINVYNDY